MSKDTLIVSEKFKTSYYIKEATNSDLNQVSKLAFLFQLELDNEKGKQYSKQELQQLWERIKTIYSKRLTCSNVEGLKHFIFLAVETQFQNSIGFVVGHVPFPQPVTNFYALRRGRYVLPNYRKQGISNKLAERFNQAAKIYGASAVEFELQNQGFSHKFLTNNAEIIRTFKHDGEIRLRMRKSLV